MEAATAAVERFPSLKSLDRGRPLYWHACTCRSPSAETHPTSTDKVLSKPSCTAGMGNFLRWTNQPKTINVLYISRFLSPVSSGFFYVDIRHLCFFTVWRFPTSYLSYSFHQRTSMIFQLKSSTILPQQFSSLIQVNILHLAKILLAPSICRKCLPNRGQISVIDHLNPSPS